MDENGREATARQAADLVLVVEDEFLIAMEVEAVLTGAGYTVLGPAATVADALRLLEDRRPDAAVLDVNLGGERVTPVAKALGASKIPFVLTTANWPVDLANEPLFSSAVNLGKPTSPSSLLSALENILAR